MTLGLDGDGRLWIRRPDGQLRESQREIARRADRLAAKLREMGVDPDEL